MRPDGPQPWHDRFAVWLAVLAITLGAMAPMLGAAHTVLHHQPSVAADSCCHDDEAPATDRDGDRPVEPVRHDDCPVCIQLTTALRHADTGDLTPPAMTRRACAGTLALAPASSPAIAPRRDTRPRAPPAA